MLWVSTGSSERDPVVLQSPGLAPIVFKFVNTFSEDPGRTERLKIDLFLKVQELCWIEQMNYIGSAILAALLSVALLRVSTQHHRL